MLRSLLLLFSLRKSCSSSALRTFKCDVGRTHSARDDAAMLADLVKWESSCAISRRIARSWASSAAEAAALALRFADVRLLRELLIGARTSIPVVAFVTEATGARMLPNIDADEKSAGDGVMEAEDVVR